MVGSVVPEGSVVVRGKVIVVESRRGVVGTGELTSGARGTDGPTCEAGAVGSAAAGRPGVCARTARPVKTSEAASSSRARQYKDKKLVIMFSF